MTGRMVIGMNEIETLRREVRLLHQRSHTIPLTCTEDGKPWPCPTVELLRQSKAT